MSTWATFAGARLAAIRRATVEDHPALTKICKQSKYTRDFTNIGLKLRSSKPDLIIPSCYLNEYVLLARSIHQNKVPKKAIYSVIGGGASNMKFVREFNAAAQGIMDCNHWIDPRKPRSQRLVSALDAAKVDLTYEVLLNYSNVLLAIDAIENEIPLVVVITEGIPQQVCFT